MLTISNVINAIRRAYYSWRFPFVYIELTKDRVERMARS